MKQLDKFIELGKELGFNHVDVYSPKGKLVAVTFSKSKKYIDKVNEIEEKPKLWKQNKKLENQPLVV